MNIVLKFLLFFKDDTLLNRMFTKTGYPGNTKSNLFPFLIYVSSVGGLQNVNMYEVRFVVTENLYWEQNLYVGIF